MKNSVVILLAVATTVLGQVRYRPPAPAVPKPTYPTRPPIIQGPLNLTFTISGRSLPSKDPGSPVDAFVKVFSRIGTTETRLGTTDVIQDNEHPIWDNVFSVIWKRGQNQKLHLVIRDNDRFARDEDVGDVTLDLDEYVDKGMDLKAPIVGGGQIHIQGTKPFSFKLYARNIPHLDAFSGRSDPFVVITWRQENGVDHVLGSTSVINNVDNADWPEKFEFSNYRKGAQQYLAFKLYDHDGVTINDFIGAQILDAESFAEKRQTVILKLTDETGKPQSGDLQLGVVPA
jgi:Ca2+-dependent lipid-binding protein